MTQTFVRKSVCFMRLALTRPQYTLPNSSCICWSCIRPCIFNIFLSFSIFPYLLCNVFPFSVRLIFVILRVFSMIIDSLFTVDDDDEKADDDDIGTHIINDSLLSIENDANRVASVLSSVCVCVCARVCACVCLQERERERESRHEAACSTHAGFHQLG